MDHIPAFERLVGGKTHRVVCSCGWDSGWQPNPSYCRGKQVVWDAWERHLDVTQYADQPAPA